MRKLALIVVVLAIGAGIGFWVSSKRMPVEGQAKPGAGFAATQTIRRDLVRRVVALDPAIDEALGEGREVGALEWLRRDGPHGTLVATSQWIPVLRPTVVEARSRTIPLLC